MTAQVGRTRRPAVDSEACLKPLPSRALLGVWIVAAFLALPAPCGPAHCLAAGADESASRPLTCRMLDVSSEHTEGGWSRQALTDGSTAAGSGWSSASHADAGSVEWCSVLLDGWRVLTGVTLWSGSDSARGLPVDFKIQFCTDLGQTWYDLPAGQVVGLDPASTRRTIALEFPEVVARGIRIYATHLGPAGDEGHSLRLAEVQAFGRERPGPFYSSISGEFDADLNNYWRIFGLGLHRDHEADPLLWGLKWWGSAEATGGDWTELKLYWHAEPRDRAAMRHWLRCLPIDADGTVWATDSAREHLGRQRLYHAGADYINKLWECYRWEGDREWLTSVPDFGIATADDEEEVTEYASPDYYIQLIAGDGLVLAQTFTAEDAFKAVRVKLQVQESSQYELRCLRQGDNQLVASRTYAGTEDHARLWTTLELEEEAEAGEYRVELRNTAAQAPGKPAVYWTHPVGWYVSDGDDYADGTSGMNGMMDLSLIEKARKAMDYLLRQEGLRGQSEGIVVITSTDHTGLPAKAYEPGGPSKPSSYFDLVRSGHKDAFVNVRYLKALESMIALERADEDARQAERLAEQLAKARAAFHKTFWNESTGRYAGWVDIRGRMWDYGEAAVNLEAVLREAAPRTAAGSIIEWLSGRRTVEGDTSKGADIYHWPFAPRKNTLAYESNGEMHHFAGGWFYDFRGDGGGRGNFGNHEQNGGTLALLAYDDVMARLAVSGPDAAWERFADGGASFMREFHRDLFNRPTAADPRHAGERFQSYVLASPECGLPFMVVLHGFMGVEPDGHVLHIRPRLPTGVDLLGLREIEFRGREYAIEVRRPDTVVIEPGAGTSRDLSIGLGHLAPGATYVATAVFASGPPAVIQRFNADDAGRAAVDWVIDSSARLRIERQP